jgi:hypothetical protein
VIRKLGFASVVSLCAVIIGACSSEEPTSENGSSSGSTTTGATSSSGGGTSSGGTSSGGASSGGSSGGAAPTNTDGIKNLDETDVDCGGASAPKCADGKGCAGAGDCASGVCDANAKKCNAPAPDDGVKNGAETGVDCGGTDAATKRCPTNEGCLDGTDCADQICTANKCAAPTKNDGKKNGDESDVDCGGTLTGAPACGVGKSCNVHADCASNGCDYNKKCADGKSCTQHFGGDTCGAAGAQESCCKSIDVPLPSGTVKIDKYTITAGRFRTFVERTNGNIRGYIQANKPAWWENVWDNMVPTQLDDGNYISHGGVYQELGPGLFFPAAGGNQGCEIHSYGARTFRVPDAVNTARWSDGQHYTQDQLDEKALQCATFFMLSAFCAWDGGRLPSVAELNYAWNKGTPASYTYPWGNTPVPAGWNDSWNNLAEAQANGTLAPAGGNQTYASFRYNWWSPANRVCAGDFAWCDYSVHVAPPGRFPNGNGPYGHADLGGNVFNMTNQIAGTPGTAVDNRNVVWFRNGSWQGHAIPYYSATDATPSSFKSLSKYWATGARCAR